MLANFPLKTGARVMAPVTLAKLVDTSHAQLVFTSHDGYLVRPERRSGISVTAVSMLSTG